MLNRLDLYAYFSGSDELLSEPAVKIHGAMMNTISFDYASKLHISEYHPYSVYVTPYGGGYIIRVSALNEEASEIISAMGGLSEIKLYGAAEPMLITDKKPYDAVSADEAGKLLTGKGCRITFVTPAMIKTGGKPTAKPDIPAYFQSVIKKYNAFENADVSYNDFLEAFGNSVMDSYELRSEKYNVSGHIFPGMTGYCDIIFPKDKKRAALLKQVIAYGTYSGVGGKTGMGMGGITVVCF